MTGHRARAERPCGKQTGVTKSGPRLDRALGHDRRRRRHHRRGHSARGDAAGAADAAGRAARLCLGHLQPLVQAGARRAALPEGGQGAADAGLGAASGSGCWHEGPGLVDPLGFLLATYEGDRPGPLDLSAPGCRCTTCWPCTGATATTAPHDFQMLAPHIATRGLAGRLPLRRRPDRRRPAGAARASGGGGRWRRGPQLRRAPSDCCATQRSGPVRGRAAARHGRRSGRRRRGPGWSSTPPAPGPTGCGQQVGADAAHPAAARQPPDLSRLAAAGGPGGQLFASAWTAARSSSFPGRASPWWAPPTWTTTSPWTTSRASAPTRWPT